MFQPAARIERGRPVSRAYKIPASVGGWHMNEPISAMDPQAAVQLDNWFPEPGSIRLRYGYQKWSSLGVSSSVDTMMVYLSGAKQSIFAASGNTIYDVTTSGSALPSMGSLGSARFQWTMFATPAGQFLVAVNGTDSVVCAYGPTGGTPAYAWQQNNLTGPTNPLTNVWEFQGRLFFTEANTANVWYLPVNSISGTASSIPIVSMLNKGGTMQAGGEWTYSTGYSILNLCVMVSSEGECIVYSGTDPTSSSTWSKVGQFTIGRPIGYRCVIKINSDMIVMCEDGLMPMSKAIQFDRAAAARGSFTWNIQKAFSDAYQSWGNVFGWQILAYAWNHMAIINIPSANQGETTNIQYVMDVLTGSWCRYLNIDAVSWVVLEDQVFFGDRAGVVWEAETGSVDAGGSPAQAPITGTWVSAYSDLDAEGRLKSARGIRVVFLTDTGLTPYLGISIDYDTATPLANPSNLIIHASYWDQAHWDQNIWESLTQSFADWVSAVGNGYQMAATVVVTAGGQTPAAEVNCRITAAYILFEPGAWLG